MSEIQHTPGPWHWESDVVKSDPTGRVRYQVTAMGKTVTRVYYSSHEGGPTNAAADARLIAEAPALLAMLRRVAALNSFRELNDLLPAVRDAIERAAYSTMRQKSQEIAE